MGANSAADATTIASVLFVLTAVDNISYVSVVQAAQMDEQ